MRITYLYPILIIIICLTQCQTNPRKSNENTQNQSDNYEELIVDEKPEIVKDPLAKQKLKEEEFLNDISGVWQESVLGRKVTLDLRGSKKKYDIGYGVYKLTVKSIDLKNKTVCFNALYNEDTKPHQMCIRQVLIGFREYYLIVDDEAFTSPWELYFIRDLAE